MNTRHLLYANAGKLSAFIRQGGKLEAEATFAEGEGGMKDFSEYLQLHRQHHFLLLANIAGEKHAIETIPRLWGKDRQILIERKFAQRFPGQRLSTSVSLGREKTEQKKEQLLFSALDDDAQLGPWLQVILDTEVAFEGIYSTSQLAGMLLTRLGHPTDQCLLFVVLDGAIRECHLRGGHTIFSRLVTLDDPSPQSIAQTYAADANKLQQYLLSQHQIEGETLLPVFVLAHPESIPLIRQACRDSKHLAFNIIDNHQAAQQLKLKIARKSDACDDLLLYLLAIKAPSQQFAGNELRRGFRLSQLRRILLGLNAALVIAGLLFFNITSQQTQALDEESHAYLKQVTALNRQHLEIAKKSPGSEIIHADLLRITKRYSELVRQQHLLLPALRMVSQIMDQTPEVELDELDWLIPKSAESGMLQEEISLSGHLLPETEKPGQQANLTYRQFVDRLHAIPNSRLEIKQSPNSQGSEREQSDESSDDKRAKRLHRISLRISRSL